LEPFLKSEALCGFSSGFSFVTNGDDPKTSYKTASVKQYTERNLPAIGKEEPQPQIIALAGYEEDSCPSHG
jgi:hypothetical protein